MSIIRPPAVTKMPPKEKQAFAWHNRELAKANFEIAEAPKTDYLVLGLFCEPEVQEAIMDWLPAHNFVERSSLYLDRKTIYAHGQGVGRIMGGQTRESRYGKKLVVHFTGKWFRDPETGRGAGMDERQAVKFIRLWANFLVKKGIAPANWLKFISIDRWDCCLELKTDLSVWDAAERITLPDRWNVRQGEWSETGHTVYAGRSKSPKANRGKYSHMAIYREFDRPDRLRVEVRVVKVRHCNPDDSYGQDEAAQLACRLLDCFSPEPLRVGQEHGCVKPLDFQMEAVPEEIQRVPHSGHAPKTLRRMTRCGMTMLVRSLRSQLVSTILASPSIMSTIDIGAYGLRDPDARDYLTDGQRLSYDYSPDEFDDVGPEQLAPFDHGATLREISQAVALNLDEVYETIAVLYDYVKIKFPDALPYHEERRNHIANTAITQPSRDRRCADPAEDFASELLCVPCSSTVRRPAGEWAQCKVPPLHLFQGVIEAEEHYIQRYLRPYDHEPLRSTKRWQAMSSGHTLTFFRPGEPGTMVEGEMIEMGSIDLK